MCHYHSNREREERKLRALKKKQLSGEGNIHKADSPRSAPARLEIDNASTRSKCASPLSLANNLESNDDISYQSTLLQMRVVGELFIQASWRHVAVIFLIIDLISRGRIRGN